MTSMNYAPLTQPATNDPQSADLSGRLAAFAQANGGEFFPYAIEQPLPGVIFRDEKGRPRASQAAGNIVRFPGPPLVEVANSMYAVPLHVSVLSRVTRAWGYAALQLPHPAPAFLLESSRAHDMPSLPVPKGAAATAVQGTHGTFSLYASDAGRPLADALLRREVLDALDDGGGLAFDLEISQAWLFLYSPGHLATADPDVWHRIFSVIGVLSANPALGLPSA